MQHAYVEKSGDTLQEENPPQDPNTVSQEENSLLGDTPHGEIVTQRENTLLENTSQGKNTLHEANTSHEENVVEGSIPQEGNTPQEEHVIQEENTPQEGSPQERNTSQEEHVIQEETTPQEDSPQERNSPQEKNTPQEKHVIQEENIPQEITPKEDSQKTLTTSFQEPEQSYEQKLLSQTVATIFQSQTPGSVTPKDFEFMSKLIPNTFPNTILQKHRDAIPVITKEYKSRSLFLALLTKIYGIVDPSRERQASMAKKIAVFNKNSLPTGNVLDGTMRFLSQVQKFKEFLEYANNSTLSKAVKSENVVELVNECKQAFSKDEIPSDETLNFLILKASVIRC